MRRPARCSICGRLRGLSSAQVRLHKRYSSRKGVRETVGERLEEKGEHGSVTRDDRSLDRHSGVELHIGHAGELVSANFDGCQEIGEACPFLGHRIGGNARHFALDHWSRSLLIGHETNRGR